MSCSGDRAALDQNGSTPGQNCTDSDLPSNVEMGLSDADKADPYPVSTGMSRKDISIRLHEAFGSNFRSSRMDELDSVCHIVYGHGELQPQEACLQMIHDSKVILINSHSLPRRLVRLLWPCGICGGSGHSIDHCPAYDGAAAAMLDLDQAEGPAAGSGSNKATVGRKAKKRSEQAAKQGEAEKATAATNDGSSTAVDELGAATAQSVAAADVALVVNGNDSRTADAAKDTQQPQDEEGAMRSRNRGAASNKAGHADGEKVRCCSGMHGAVQSATTAGVKQPTANITLTFSNIASKNL